MSDLLFGLPTWLVALAVFSTCVIALIVFCACVMAGDADDRIERIERRMVELNRQDVDERAQGPASGIYFDGGWSKR